MKHPLHLTLSKQCDDVIKCNFYSIKSKFENFAFKGTEKLQFKQKIFTYIYIITSRTFTFCVMRFKKFKNCVDNEREMCFLWSNVIEKQKETVAYDVALKLLNRSAVLF